MDPAFTLTAAHSPADVDAVRALFREYGRTPQVAVCVVGFDEEIATLPGAYAAPRGTLLLARVGEEPAGCVALRPIDDGVGEMKRLFVRPEFRGRHIGEALTRAIVEAASTLGYRRVRLDTLPEMKEARALYSRLGFREVPPPAGGGSGVSYFELAL